MQDRRAYYILPTDKALELVASANADLNEKLECLVNGLGQEGFDTLVALAEKAKRLSGCSRETPGGILFPTDLDTGLIKCVNVGGEMAPKGDVRPIEFEWVKNLYLEAKERNIEFYFHQCGSMFLRDGVNIGKWKLHDQIARAEEIQKELEMFY